MPLRDQLDQRQPRGNGGGHTAAHDAPPPLPPSAPAAATATATIVVAAPMTKRGTSAGDDDDDDDDKAHNDARGYSSSSNIGRRAAGKISSCFGGRGGGRCPSSPPLRPAAAAAARALLRPLLRLPRPLRLLVLALLPLLLAGAALLALAFGGGGGGAAARAAARDEAAALAARLYHVSGGLVHPHPGAGGGAAAPSSFASANGALRDVRVSPLRTDRAYRREAAAAMVSAATAGANEAKARRREREEEMLLRAVVEECARGEDTAIWLDPASGAVISQPLRGGAPVLAAAKDPPRRALAGAAAALAAVGGAPGPASQGGGGGGLPSDRSSVVRLEAAAGGLSGLDPRHCPPLDVMLRGPERGVGMCTDVALYVLQAGARVVPMPRTAEARRAYDAQCGRRTARMFLETMYREFFHGAEAEAAAGAGGEGAAGGGDARGDGGGDGNQEQQRHGQQPTPLSGVLHLHLLNSEHMFLSDAPLHARVDAFLCKTRFCERLARAHVRRRGLRAAVWFVGHTSADPTVGTLPMPPPSDPAELVSPAAGEEEGDEGAGDAGAADAAVDAAAPVALSGRASAASLRRRRAEREREMHAQLRSVGALHVKGKSGLKHTAQLLRCWGGRPDLPRLVVVGELSLKEAREGGALRAPNVVFFPTVRGSERYVAARRPDYAAVARLADSGGLGDEAVRLMVREEEEARDLRRRAAATAAAAAAAAKGAKNVTLSVAAAAPAVAAAAAIPFRPDPSSSAAAFGHVRALQSRAPLHLCVSEREGFGHYLNEARAAGALVVTTAHPPMNELVSPSTGLLVRPVRTESHEGMALGAYGRINAAVSPEGVCAAVDRALSMRPREAARRRLAARRAFEEGRAEFRARLADLAAFARARSAEATRVAVAAAGGSEAAGGPPLV